MKKTYDVRIVMTEEKKGEAFTRTITTYLDGRKWKIPHEVAIHVAREYLDEIFYEKELEYREEIGNRFKTPDLLKDSK